VDIVRRAFIYRKLIVAFIVETVTNDLKHGHREERCVFVCVCGERKRERER
jgi:hypothetical protein